MSPNTAYILAESCSVLAGDTLIKACTVVAVEYREAWEPMEETIFKFDGIPRHPVQGLTSTLIRLLTPSLKRLIEFAMLQSNHSIMTTQLCGVKLAYHISEQ